MRIGLLGMGTIGSAVAEQIAGLQWVELVRILEKRFTGARITGDIQDILSDDSIDTVVEVLGGVEPAYTFASEAIKKGKHLVTANKQLVCEKGMELEALARRNGVAFLYTAACGGTIPFLSNLAYARESDLITELGGIMNGTTNFILDGMQTDPTAAYDDMLARAQALGYAERDPSGDVDGLDTMRKLVLACRVGLDACYDPAGIPVRGIRSISRTDIAWAEKRGAVIRLEGIARPGEAYVCPTMRPRTDPRAEIRGCLNLIRYVGKSSGPVTLTGAGAGGAPTAVGVIRDLRAVQAGIRSLLCDPAPTENRGKDHIAEWYVRFPDGADFPPCTEYTENPDGTYSARTKPIPMRDLMAFMPLFLAECCFPR